MQQGLKANPGMTSATALLGISLFEMADYSRARPLLESSLKANPKDTNAQLYLAKILIKLGDTNVAAAPWKNRRQQPKNQEVFYLLARVYMQMSEQAFARMNAIDPDSVLTHQLSAEVMESMNNYDGAVVELKKAVDMAPHLPGNHYKLGDAYWNLSAWRQATEQFTPELESIREIAWPSGNSAIFSCRRTPAPIKHWRCSTRRLPPALRLPMRAWTVPGRWQN